MKNLILIFALIFTVAKAQTNIYHPFPDSAASWNFNYLFVCLGAAHTQEEFSIIISGDTTIGTTPYHKLNIPYVQTIVPGLCAGNSSGYQGAFRNDTANRKVYFVAPADTAEQLLYDFNMQLGDTVKGYLQTMAVTTDVVHWIDSVLVGNDFADDGK